VKRNTNFTRANGPLIPVVVGHGEQLNYAKGNYVGLCKHMDIDWELCLAQHNNIEDMWTAFKVRLLESIEQHTPKISKFYDWRKPSWRCPLPKNVREKIKIKHRLWNSYLDTKNVDFLRKFKKIRNEIRKITIKAHP